MCGADSKEFNSINGTTNMWRHFLKDFTRIVPDDQGNEKGIVQCNICQSRLKATSDGKPSLEGVGARHGMRRKGCCRSCGGIATTRLRFITNGIHRAIERISASNCPTSNLCLLELFNVREILQSDEMLQASNRGGHNGFVDNKNATTVLTELREILDKAIQDSYLVWSIPFLLDPRQNLESLESIFKGAFGEHAGSSMSERVTAKLKELYSYYADRWNGLLMAFESSDYESDDDISREELDRYLTLGVSVHPTEGFDILNWWKVHGLEHYPAVADMAKDALAMPTCSQLSSDQIAHVKSLLRGYSKYEE
jgi:hypothetical protein